jgi:hypothetical protein
MSDKTAEPKTESRLEREGLNIDAVIADYDKVYRKAMNLAVLDYKRAHPNEQAVAGQAPKMDVDDVRYHVACMIELAKIEKITVNNNFVEEKNGKDNG